jgi:hypothetical protein
VADRVHHRIGRVGDGRVGAPRQLAVIAGACWSRSSTMNTSTTSGTARCARATSPDLPLPPESDRLTRLDGYLVIDPTG